MKTINNISSCNATFKLAMILLYIIVIRTKVLSHKRNVFGNSDDENERRKFEMIERRFVNKKEK